MVSIYVGNLPFRVTEDEVASLFSEFGEVQRVHLVMDRETGRPRGFGFVEMGDCLLYTSPSPRDLGKSRMPSSA